MRNTHPEPSSFKKIARRWWPAAVAATIAIAATVITVLQPLGTEEAGTAALDAVETDAMPETSTILAQERWGDGVIILVRFDDRRGVRHLSLAFVIDHGRGWRVAGRTENQAEPDDVVVGSLLVASSPGGTGQPAWSAVYGEVDDDRIGAVEVTWADGEQTSGDLSGDAYLVVRRGEHEASSVRFLGTEDDEIAVVPIQDG